MKLNRRFAGMLLAGAMVAGMMAMPAGAEGSSGGIQTGATVTIEKVLDKGEAVYTPRVDIGFTVTAAEVAPGETDLDENVVCAGVQEAIGTVTPARFGTEEFDPDLYEDIVTANASFTIDPTAFTSAGVYKYTVTENDPGYPGITKDESVKILYVYVVNNQDYTGLEVISTILMDAQSKTKTNCFENTFETYFFMVRKDITGAAADLNRKWEFQVTVGGQEGARYLLLTSDGDSVTLEPGEPATILLGHKDMFYVYGLPQDNPYIIVETAANTDGYTTTIDGVESSDGTVASTLNEDTDIIYTNTKEYSAPTGLLMDIAPYAAMVLLAAAAAFVFLRRRTNED